MYEKIKDIFENAVFDEMVNKQLLEYKDKVDKSDINENSNNYLKMKYFCGLITVDEHNNYSRDEFKSLPEVYDIYNNYILTSDDLLCIDLTKNIDNSIVELIIEIFASLSKKSEWKEKFEKLIFALYCQIVNDNARVNEYENISNILYFISKEIFDKYDWTRGYASKMNVLDKFLVYCKNNNNYNAKYGITESIIADETKNDNNGDLKSNTPEQKEDWILKKFGDGDGKSTSLAYN